MVVVSIFPLPYNFVPKNFKGICNMQTVEIQINFIKHIQSVDPGNDKQQFWRNYLYLISIKGGTAVPFDFNRSQVNEFGNALSALQELNIDETIWKTLAIEIGLKIEIGKLAELMACPSCRKNRRIMKNRISGEEYWICCDNILVSEPIWVNNCAY